MSNGLFVSWTRENGRTADLARALGVKAHYFYLPSRFGLLGRYIRQLKATRALLAKQSSGGVVLMLPPAPALLAFVWNRAARRFPIACDLHTGFFSDPKWAWSTGLSLRLMRRIGAIAVVTNDALAQVCHRYQVETVVMHDVLSAADHLEAADRYLLCPLSYANDEPVAEVLEAARRTPDIEWRLTGRAPESVKSQAPTNVTFTGFVNEEEYRNLLTGAHGVVALTTRAHTMQRAGYESFCAGVPHVTSDFPELREFYGESAEYADPSASSIASAVMRLSQHRDTLLSNLQTTRTKRISEQQFALSTLRKFLGIPAGLDSEKEASQ